MLEKRLLIPDRVRRPPREGFSWIDRRFLRDYAPRRRLPALAFDSDEIVSAVVSSHARVHFDGDRYSVPADLARKG